MTGYQIIKPKDRSEWLQHREKGIGSSEVATILGLNPFETRYQLWRRKKGLDKPKVENFAMKAGHYLEDAVAMFYADETGKEIIKASKGDWLIVDKEKEYLRVSPDRTFWIPDRPKKEENKGILECKTTQRDVDEGNIPMHWFVQLQYQLGVARKEQGALAWLCSGRSFGCKDYMQDGEFYKWLVEEVDKFWIDNIVGGQEPEPMNITDVLLKHPKHEIGKMILASGSLLGDLARLKEVKEEIKALESQGKELEERIKMAMGDAEALTGESGEILATWKAAKDSEKFDEKLFRQENEDLHSRYVKIIKGSRRFLIK